MKHDCSLMRVREYLAIVQCMENICDIDGGAILQQQVFLYGLNLSLHRIYKSLIFLLPGNNLFQKKTIVFHSSEMTIETITY